MTRVVRPENRPAKRTERLISAYDAGCQLARNLRSRIDEAKAREVARQQGYFERDEINCFVAALRNHCSG
ncbi:MAG: hypothetical protein HWE12_02220 [Oceanospirillaceae bacterium]|nr:hypothetical protein [Oceanospirillaceae bacterium]